MLSKSITPFYRSVSSLLSLFYKVKTEAGEETEGEDYGGNRVEGGGKDEEDVSWEWEIGEEE